MINEYSTSSSTSKSVENKKKKPLVSIVIPSWFMAEGHDGRYGSQECWLIASECLNRLIEVTPKDLYELILVDNGSDLTDENVIDKKFMPSWYWKQADVLIRNEKNLGFAPAVNEGVNASKGEYILILNNDIHIRKNFLENLLKAFELPNVSPPIGAIMPNLIKKEHYRDRPELFNERGKLDTYKIMKLADEEIRYPSKDRLESGSEFGSAFMMKRETVDKIKALNKEELGKEMFFDENFLVGFGEDRKIWNQIRLIGEQTYRTNYIRCQHIGNLSMTKIPNRQKYTSKNREYLTEWKKKHNITN